MSKKKSRATKTVLASLLATSAIVPAMAVSADVNGSQTVTGTEATTRTVQDGVYTANFKIDNAELAKYVKGPAIVTIKEGKTYVNFNISESMIGMVTAATVGGKSIIVEADGKKKLEVEVASVAAPIEGNAKLNIPFGNVGEVSYDFKLTIDPTTIAKAETEAPAEVVAVPAVDLADGKYKVNYITYRPDTMESGFMDKHLTPSGTLVVKDGKYSLQFAISDASNSLVSEVKYKSGEKEVDAQVVSGSATENPRIVSVPLANSTARTEAGVYVIPVTKWYWFDVAVDPASLQKPEKIEESAPEVTEPAKPAPTVETIPVSVFKDGEKELSIMHGKYLADTVQVTATEGGYNVDVTFPEGQHLKGFEVKGATVALKSEEVVGANTVKIYTVAVKDLTEIYNATVDLSVRQGPVSYDSVYPVQLQFGDKKSSAVPFTDINGLANYEAIVALYAKGIFIKAEKFNPQNNVKRSQFALMLNRALSLEVPASTKFADIASYDAETQNAIKALNNYGVINGKTATAFAPSQEITRKQAALMIYRLLEKKGYTATGATANFKDVSSKDAEAAKAIAELNKLGIMTGFEGKFNPENKLTRNQMAKVLNNALQAMNASK